MMKYPYDYKAHLAAAKIIRSITGYIYNHYKVEIFDKYQFLLAEFFLIWDETDPFPYNGDLT